LAADFPTVARYHRDVAGSMNNLANNLRQTGRRAEALALYEAAIRHQRQALEREPQNVPSLSFLAHHQQNLGILLADLGRRNEAEAQLHESLALWEKLAADFPSLPEYVIDRGIVYIQFGHVVRDSSRPQESLEWYAKGITVLKPLLDKEPSLASGRKLLSESYWGRAWVLDRHGRHAEAIPEWEQAFGLDSGENRPVLQLGRTISQAHVSGDHRPALAAAEALAKDRDVSALEGLARLCALASVAVGSGERPTPEARDLQEQYAARAVALLRQAIGQGYRDSLYLKEGTDLAPLRSRQDFLALLADVEAKSDTRSR
jgi:tetratricopeptide (TPR) repeat protein